MYSVRNRLHNRFNRPVNNNGVLSEELEFWILKHAQSMEQTEVPVSFVETSIEQDKQKGTSRQRSGKGAIRKRFPLQKPRWEKTKLTIRYLYHETYRKPNEQLFSQ